MNPLSLLGMTMGARKRAARAIAMAEALRGDPDMPFWARNLTERPMEAEPRDRREALRYFHGNERTHDEAVTYRIVRARYRIGERLRPCPWKHDERGCMGQGQEGSGPGDAYCDGSGVLPARVKSQASEATGFADLA